MFTRSSISDAVRKDVFFTCFNSFKILWFFPFWCLLKFAENDDAFHSQTFTFWTWSKTIRQWREGRKKVDTFQRRYLHILTTPDDIKYSQVQWIKVASQTRVKKWNQSSHTHKNFNFLSKYLPSMGKSLMRALNY
jgi:hypothetical protein